MNKTVIIRGISNRELFKRIRTALQKSFKGKGILRVSGKPRTVASLIAALERAEAGFKEVEVAQAQVRALIVARNAALVGHNKLGKDIIRTLEVYWGADSPKLVAAGIRPKKKRRTLTAKEKLAATIKRNLTRKMRGTMGPRQKAALKAQGTVQVTVETKSSIGPALPPPEK